MTTPRRASTRARRTPRPRWPRTCPSAATCLQSSSSPGSMPTTTRSAPWCRVPPFSSSTRTRSRPTPTTRRRSRRGRPCSGSRATPPAFRSRRFRTRAALSPSRTRVASSTRRASWSGTRRRRARLCGRKRFTTERLYWGCTSGRTRFEKLFGSVDNGKVGITTLESFFALIPVSC